MKNVFVASSLISISGLICSCSDPTTQMEFRASIERQGNGRLELVSVVSNYSDTPKMLNDIDIDSKLHEALGLTSRDKRNGSYLPLDDTVSYVINKNLNPKETYRFTLIGKESDQFVSGDVDFIINNDNWNFRSVSVSCCL